MQPGDGVSVAHATQADAGEPQVRPAETCGDSHGLLHRGVDCAMTIVNTPPGEFGAVDRAPFTNCMRCYVAVNAGGRLTERHDWWRALQRLAAILGQGWMVAAFPACHRLPGRLQSHQPDHEHALRRIH